MSKVDILNDEISRRKLENDGLAQSEADLIAAIEQFNKLDELMREQERDSRVLLECTYKESRHFTGEWPIVYQFTETEKRPYFKNDDADCNPYFPVTKVQDETFDGVAPLIALVSRTGAHQRQRSFTATEDITRAPALIELQNFPDISGEPLPSNFPAAQGSTVASCSNPIYVDQATCELNGETWDPGGLIADPIWNGPDTAPALLRVALNTWRADMVIIISDLCNDTGTEATYWQNIIDDIDVVLPAIATDAVFVRSDPNPDPATWGQTQPLTGAEESARSRLETAANSGVLTHISTRLSSLTEESDSEEKAFFTLIELRLHQVSGSFSKLQTAKGQLGQSADLIESNNKAIADLNVMKVKSS